jgi:hypothetical protein
MYSNSDIFTFDFLSWSELIQRYDSISNAQHQETNHDDDQVNQQTSILCTAY